ncbi:MAG TPA: hypothetical protein VHL98_20500 [Microvirga sp.]|jgi:hypothetical protein|nr:hypothetical protein [Microvirga sp.]
MVPAAAKRLAFVLFLGALVVTALASGAMDLVHAADLPARGF